MSFLNLYNATRTHSASTRGCVIWATPKCATAALCEGILWSYINTWWSKHVSEGLPKLLPKSQVTLVSRPAPEETAGFGLQLWLQLDNYKGRWEWISECTVWILPFYSKYQLDCINSNNLINNRKASEVVICFSPWLSPSLEKKQFIMVQIQIQRRHLFRVFAAKAQFSRKWKRKTLHWYFN